MELVVIGGFFALLAGILGVLVYIAVSLGSVKEILKRHDDELKEHNEKLTNVDELKRHCPLFKK